MTTKRHYQWNRFWSPRTGQVNLGDGGFLWDPENEHGSIYNPDVKSFAEIEALPVLGLLGEPGIGKSFTIEKLVEDARARVASDGGQVLYVDLRSVGSEQRLEKKVFESEEFKAWNETKTPLYIFLDSLDECLLSVKTASRLLSDELKKYPQQNILIRIACRTWDWPLGFENDLRDLWGEENIGVFELTPLRRKDVIEAVVTNDLEPEQFIQEVYSREVVSLAIKPLTLKMLMNIYEREGGLPASKAEIYRHGCLLLTDEPNLDRRDSQFLGKLSPQQRLIVGARIAALSVYCGKNAIWTGPDDSSAPKEDLTFADLVGGIETVAGHQFEISESVLRETLSTGLFSSRGVHRMGLGHQSYAEYLAAYYLTYRQVSTAQIVSLVCHPGDAVGRLVPQLYEVSAWLVSMNHEILSCLMEIDPEVLLRGDLSAVGINEKKALVQKLLWLYDEGGAIDSDWDLRDHYCKLNHPDLVDQLKPIITDSSKGVIVRRVAIDIAEACGLHTLQSELSAIALSPEENDHIREQAARAVWIIGDETTKQSLKPLALGNVGNDVDDEMKGYALKALWPDYITAEELFDYLTPPKNDNLIGSYYYFLIENISPVLDSDNMSSALSWVENVTTEWRRKYVQKELVSKISSKAWELLDAPGVADAFAKLVLALINKHEYELLHELKTEDCESKKQTITNAMLSQVDSSEKNHDGYYFLQTGFFKTGDVPWLIELSKREKSSKARKYLAEMVEHLFVYEQAGMILEACETDHIFAEKFKGIREAVLLDSPEAKRMRKNAQRGKQDRKKIDPSPMVRIVNILDKSESGHPDSWVSLVLNMARDEYGHSPWPDSDVQKLPGWQNADSNTRKRIVSAAKEYLLSGEPRIDSLFENSTYFEAIVSDHAFRLLLTEDAKFVESMGTEAWKKWAKVVLAYSSRHENNEQDQLLLRLAYEHAPEQITEGVAQIIEKDKQGHFISLHQVTSIWDERLALTILEKMPDPELTPRAQANLLEILLEQGVVEAQRFAEALIPMPLPVEEDERTRAVLAAKNLMRHAHDAGWTYVWPAIQAESSFGHSLIAQLSETVISRLTDEQSTDLYIWLERNYLLSNEQINDEPRRPTDFKDTLLRHLKTRGTLGACQGFERIIVAFPDMAWLKWSLHECQALYRRNTWLPPTPREILSLTENRSSVLVRTGEELLEVVIASLRRLEQKLHGVTPMARFLWNVDRPKEENDFSDYVENHLKEDLKRRGIVANREVEFRRLSQSGVGEKTDIVVDAICKNNSGFESATVVIECKGCWNKDLNTAMATQLQNRYLIDDMHRHGLYLVSWCSCDQWDGSDYRKKQVPKMTIAEAQAFYDKQAESLSKGGHHIRALMLNTALPGK